MKSITEIIGGAQGLLDISYELQDIFEEYLTDEYKTFLQMLRILEEAQPCQPRNYAGIGRRPYQYGPFIRAAYAMRYFRIDTVKSLIQRLKGEPNLRLLCGFTKIPSKATFSRAYAALSETTVLQETLDTIVVTAHKDTVVYHVSRDSTAIEAREKVAAKKPEKKEKKRRGRPKKGEARTKQPEKTLEKQASASVEQSLQDINTACAWGCKKNSQGNVTFWKGYKLHLDVSDIGFPLSAFVSGANVHDSQLAIPLEKMTEQKTQFCYSLMDSAYDAQEIDTFIRGRGRVPIIDPNKRRNVSRPPLDPAKQERFKFRSGVERANGFLKDFLLPTKLWVKGHAKVSFVLLSAVVCLAALRTLQYFIL
jgi:transposase